MTELFNDVGGSQLAIKMPPTYGHYRMPCGHWLHQRTYHAYSISEDGHAVFHEPLTIDDFMQGLQKFKSLRVVKPS